MKLRSFAITTAAAAALSLSACSSAPPQDTSESSTEAIQDGTPDGADPSVGLLYRPPGTRGSGDHGDWCSGTLIAPDLVLTAAHCFVSQNGGPTGMTQFYVGQGVPKGYHPGNTVPFPDVSMTEIDVKDYRVHPQYQPLTPVTNDQYDVAVVLLTRPAGAAIPYATSASDAPPVGATGTAVGYGWHGAWDDPNLTILAKRSATETVQAEPSTQTPMLQMVYGSGLATHGDSGGPLFFNGKIVATVAGHMPDRNTLQDPWPTHYTEYYVRTDGVAPAIDDMVSQLTAECENTMCYTQQQCIDDGFGTTCTCLAQWYACRRRVCGEHLPVISCRFGF